MARSPAKVRNTCFSAHWVIAPGGHENVTAIAERWRDGKLAELGFSDLSTLVTDILDAPDGV